MARVSVHRTHDRDVRQRQVIVRLDDGPAATLMFGENYSTELPPGPHVLHVDNTLFKKQVAFDLGDSDVEFDIINHSGRLGLSFMALMGVAPLYIDIERRT